MIRPERRMDVQRFVHEVRKDMRRNLESPRTLRQYAEIGGISIGHLSRAFTAIIGMSFRKELRRVRIAEARRLLATTPMKVSVIARRVGLRDPSQFIADFRSELGVTPGQFRERVAKRTTRTDFRPNPRNPNQEDSNAKLSPERIMLSRQRGNE